MRILLLNLLYVPDMGPSAAQFSMLCEDLATLGHEVTTIAAVPHYPSGLVADGYRGRVFQRELRNGVEVIRVWVPSLDRSRMVSRAMSFLAYQLLASCVPLRGRFDVVIASNPALEVALPFFIRGVTRRKPIVYSVHDLYPDVGVKLGIFRNRVMVRLVARLEDYCLMRAAAVRVLSDGFKTSVQERGVPPSKITVIWDWVDTDFIRPLPRVNSFARKWNLADRFVVMYAGNIGLSQGLEDVLEVAKRLQSGDFDFVFIGDGGGKRGLAERAAKLQLDNVTFLPFQVREALPEVLASADVSLIMLKRGLGTDSVPSKCYSIMASERPVVASVDEGSDTWTMISKASCGVCVRCGDVNGLADAILRLYADEAYRKALGANGRAYVTRQHSRQAACKAFDQLLRSLVPQPQAASCAG